MGIWLNEMADEVKREVRASLRDRRMLRLALEDRHAAAHEGAGPDCVLLLLEACVRPNLSLPEEDAETLLHAEVARQVFPGFRLRSGQAALLVPGPVDLERIRRLLGSMTRRIQKTAQDHVVLAFGIARALEARRGITSWLSLADLRLQAREEKLKLNGKAAPTPPVGERRRRVRKEAAA